MREDDLAEARRIALHYQIKAAYPRISTDDGCKPFCISKGVSVLFVFPNTNSFRFLVSARRISKSGIVAVSRDEIT